MKDAPKYLTLGLLTLVLDREKYPSLPTLSLSVSKALTLWKRIRLAFLLVFSPAKLGHSLTHNEVLVLSNMVEVYGLVRAVRMIKKRSR